MFLKQMKEKSGRVRMAIYESWWDGTKPRQRMVQPLGFLDELSLEHEDPVLWAKQIAKEMTQAKKASEQTVTIELHPMEKIDMRTSNEKNMGCAVILSQYGALGIETALRSASRNSRAKYDINAILRLIVCERIVEPSSKLAAWENRVRYFFSSNFSRDDTYRALDNLVQAKATILSTMNRQIAQSGLRDLSALYYDVTNYYFETDTEDEWRRRGVSKERRPNPIVQMGLIQDKRGIPLAYKVFPGNTSDCTTMMPVLAELKKDHNLKRVVTVADKGLNCSENIAFAVVSGDGFVFSQSIRGTKSDKDLKSWVLDSSDYQVGNDFKIKSKQGYKTVHLKAKDCADDKAQDVQVEVKYVAFWSKDYERRARHERAKTIEKAISLVKNPSAYTRATSYGAAKYVKGIHFDKETGIICNKRELSLDESAIAEEEALDGYYLIVTSEINWTDDEILNAYRELWRIEETFKVTKSELVARPVYVWTPAHIEAHFLTCYIALVILRLLQLISGLSCGCIREQIAKMNYINVDANWWVSGYRTDVSDALVDAVGLKELKLKNLQTKDAKNILAKAKKCKLPHTK